MGCIIPLKIAGKMRLPRPVISEDNRKLFEEGRMLLIDKPYIGHPLILVRKLGGMRIRIKSMQEPPIVCQRTHDHMYR